MRQYFLIIYLFIIQLSAQASITLPTPDAFDTALVIVPVDDHLLAYYQGKGGIGCMDTKGKRLTPDHFYGIHPINQELYKVQSSAQSKYAILNSNGKLITPYDYDEISPFIGDHAIVHKKDNDQSSFAIAKNDGQIVSEWVDSIIGISDQQILTIYHENKWGIIQHNEKLYFDQKFQSVGVFNIGLAPAQSQQGLWGYINQDGNWTISPLYKDAQTFNGKYAAVKNHSNQWQIIDRKGNIVQQTTYDSIKIYEGGAYSIVYNNNKGTFLGFNAHPLNRVTYDEIEPFSTEGIATCKRNQKYVYVNNLGDEIFEADSLSKFKFGVGIFKNGTQWGWVNEDGQELQKANYDSILSYNKNGLIVQQNQKVFLVSLSGNHVKEILTTDAKSIIQTSNALLFPTKSNYFLVDLIKSESQILDYDEVGEIHAGIIVVKKDDKYGYIDVKNQVILPNEYHNVSIPNHLFYILQKDITDKSIAYNKSMEEQFTLPDDTKYIGPLQENRARIIDKKGLMGFIDEQGKVIVPCKYPIVGDFHQNRAIFTNLQEKMGYLDEKGNEIIAPIYKFASNFDASGHAAVIKDEKFGFIHTSGNVVVPFVYDKVLSLSNGIASVESNGKVGYINMQNKKLIPFTFDEAYQSQEGLALVRMGIYWGYINPKGKVLIPWQYSEAQGFSEGKAWVKLDKKWGAINTNGSYIIPLKYDQTLPFQQQFARVAIDNKWGLIRENGQEVIPTICNKIGKVYENKVIVEINQSGYGIIITP